MSELGHCQGSELGLGHLNLTIHLPQTLAEDLHKWKWLLATLVMVARRGGFPVVRVAEKYLKKNGKLPSKGTDVSPDDLEAEFVLEGPGEEQWSWCCSCCS